jgi:hypothetical protein
VLVLSAESGFSANSQSESPSKTTALLMIAVNTIQDVDGGNASQSRNLVSSGESRLNSCMTAHKDNQHHRDYPIYGGDTQHGTRMVSLGERDRVLQERHRTVLLDSVQEGSRAAQCLAARKAYLWNARLRLTYFVETN